MGKEGASKNMTQTATAMATLATMLVPAAVVAAAPAMKNNRTYRGLKTLGMVTNPAAAKATQDKGTLGNRHPICGPQVALAGVDLHMLNEELSKGHLAAQVDKIGEEGPPDAREPSGDQRMLPHLPTARGGAGGGGYHDFREPVGTEEDDAHDERQTEDEAGKRSVEDDDAAELVATGGCPARHQTSTRAERVSFGLNHRAIRVEDESIGEEGGNDRANTSECLGDQDA